MQQTPFLTGQFLLAMPGIGDPRFERSVIAVCSHDEAGAFGLCLSTEIATIRVHGLMDQLEIAPDAAADAPILFGGPVEPQRGFILHSPDYSGQDTRYVGDRWAVTGTRDILEAIARGSGPANWLVALGYAGWEGGQLEEELAQNGWFTTPATTALLWNTRPEDRWREGFAAEGVDVALLSADAGRA